MLWWRGETSWGRCGEFTFDEASVHSLRAWCKILRNLESLAFAISIVLVIFIGLVSVYAMNRKSFENIIFYDGTERLCYMEGSSGRIRAIEQ